MTVSTLRPSGTTSNTGALTGGASADAVLSDDSDSSYVQYDANETSVLALGDLTLPAGAVIKGHAIRARTAKVTTNGLVFVASTLTNLGQTAQTVSWSTPTTTSFVSQERAGITDSAADSNELTIGCPPGTPAMRVYEAYVDMTYVEQPVVTVDAPASPVTDTNLPTVEWTATLDSDGGAQTSYRVILFTDAQYSIGGFDPETSPSTIDTGSVSGAATSWQVTETLPDDTYRAYVLVAQTVNGVDHWSAADYVEFTVSVALPAVPTLTATVDNANARIQLDLDDRLNLCANPEAADGTTTGWTNTSLTALAAVTLGSGGAPAADATLTALDVTTGLHGTSDASGDRASISLAVTSGHTYAFSVYARVATNTATGLGLQARSAANALKASSSTLSTTGVWTRLSLTVTADATETWTFWVTQLGAGGVDFYWTAVLLEESSSVGTYDSGTATTDVFEIQRSLDGGTTWETVRQLEAGYLTPSSGAFTLYDYEATNGTLMNYRARAAHDYSGVYAASDWATDTATWTSTEWWLKDPVRPDLNRQITVRDLAPVQRAGRRGVFQALGATSAVVITDTRGPKTGTITLRESTIAEQDAIDELLDTLHTLLLQGPADHNPPGYVRFGEQSRARVIGGGDANEVFDTLEYTVVASPTDDVVAWS